MHPTDMQLTAIATNDATFDGQFFYGVTSTDIFCRPSCASRLPNRDHIVIFATADEALTAGFRPCKRCRPTGQQVSAETWVAEINAVLEAHYAEALDLNTIATLVHGSPSYLEHVYTKTTGMSVMAHLITIRMAHAKELLTTTRLAIHQIATRIGLSATYFSTQFKQHTGMSPRDYRKQK